jgi:hypothetical protein
MIRLNDQDVEALLKMSDKELVKLAVAPTAAIRLRRDAAHVQHLPDIEVERKQIRRVLGFLGQDGADHLARRSPSGPAPAPAGKSRMRDLGERPTLARVQLPESIGSGKVRRVGYGRKALALSVHPSGLGFIGRQIKLGRSPQRRQRQRRDGGDRCAPPQFLLRHGFAPWTCAVRNCPTGWIIAQVPIFTAH